jgi:hypothetical protein
MYAENKGSKMAEEQQDTIEVMLDIYSGRPNPSWALSDRLIEELRTLIAANVEQLRENRFVTPYLGYSGFIITNHQQLVGIPYRMRVYGGVLTVTEEKAKEDNNERSKTTYYDDTHRLEAWLLEQAVEHGYADAIERMGGTHQDRDERNRPRGVQR